ncbi:MAG TPA: 2,3-bisphosphoglycerate-independent phosphoglycerate mutase, partial [Clostridiales bacterium]|nr:2,3-bisphosphoglycerate-independent phosphoglycerate mutase [Clostridiales bacterium]
MKTRPVCLIIMDGYGIRKDENGNAIKQAHAGVVERLIKEWPSTQLGASGLDVGLPDGQMGNSEVGHLNMGAGRIIYQDLTRITKEIQDGDFFKNEELLKAVENAKKNNKSLHIFGLLSEGGVHSHITHLYALLELAKQHGLEKVYVHAFMDGRDVPPKSGAGYISTLQDKIKEIGVGKISTITGRYYAMDRDNNWDREKLAYDSLTIGKGKLFEDPVKAVEASYADGVTDEFILPINITENGKPFGLVEQGDSIIFFNFRPDRAREITRAFSEKEFDFFKRETGFLNPYYVCFTVYDASFTNVHIAFKKQEIKNTLGEYLAHKGYTQLRIAETEKYAH